MSTETPKDIESFKESLKHDAPPKGLGRPLEALWHASKGSWEKAHEVVMDDESKAAAWVHAHLHRRQGDAANANYWYARADKPPHDGPFDEELNTIAFGLLAQGGR
jgi:hypothetical protein